MVTADKLLAAINTTIGRTKCRYLYPERNAMKDIALWCNNTLLFFRDFDLLLNGGYR